MIATAAALLLFAQTTAPAPAQAPPVAPVVRPSGAIVVPAAPYVTPQRILSPGGEILITSPGEQRAYDGMHYAPARRAGDVLYLSGVVGHVLPADGEGAEGIRAATRRAFRSFERQLKAHGAGFADVAMINTFHVWNSGGVSRDQHFAAFSAAKDEFMPPPHSAWTAVGTSGLLADDGFVEIQMIAHVPKGAPPAR